MCAQPCFAFVGEQFESDPDFRLAKSMLLDLFRGRLVESINLKVRPLMPPLLPPCALWDFGCSSEYRRCLQQTFAPCQLLSPAACLQPVYLPQRVSRLGACVKCARPPEGACYSCHVVYCPRIRSLWETSGSSVLRRWIARWMLGICSFAAGILLRSVCGVVDRAWTM